MNYLVKFSMVTKGTHTEVKTLPWAVEQVQKQQTQMIFWSIGPIVRLILDTQKMGISDRLYGELQNMLGAVKFRKHIILPNKVTRVIVIFRCAGIFVRVIVI